MLFYLYYLGERKNIGILRFCVGSIGTFGTVYWDFWYGLLGLLVRWMNVDKWKTGFYWDLKYEDKSQKNQRDFCCIRAFPFGVLLLGLFQYTKS